MSDLIAAVATGSAVSAICVIRLSGDGAVDTAGRLFAPADGRPLADHGDRQLIYGTLRDRMGQTLDLCLCTVSRAPRSYTGEDTAELQLHGSPVLAAQTLEELFALGARQALPGEFTKRAFLNGKMDLTGAEAVIDLIESETPAAVRNAAGQLSGAVFRRSEAAYRILTDMAAHFQAAVDWPDEDVPPFELEAYAGTLETVAGDLESLLDTYGRGRVLRSGIRCVILGRPNVGKSSLLNALAGYERVIVTPEAGTTRDTVEERVAVGGILLRLTDTAGVRAGETDAERQGVLRALEAAETAELVLAVFDGSEPMTEEDEQVLRTAAGRNTVAVVNKCDLPRKLDAGRIEDTLGQAVELSAVAGTGLDRLEAAVSEKLPKGGGAPQGEILTNARQAEAVSRALESVREAGLAARTGMTPDAVLIGLEDAMEALAQLTGRSVTEDVTDSIFRRFCVGK